MTRRVLTNAAHHNLLASLVLSILMGAGMIWGALTDEQIEDLASRFTSAERAIEQRDYRRASQLVSTLVGEYGRSEYADELRFVLGQCYFNAGDYDLARREFERVSGRARYGYIRPEADIGLALSLIKIRDYGYADQVLQRVLKQRGYADDARLHLALGLVRYELRDYAGAVAELKADTLPEAQFYLGCALARLHRPREALLAFKNVTQITPPLPITPLAHFATAQALFMNSDFDGALVKFKYFLDNYPNHALAGYAHFFMGCAQLYAKKYSEALAEFTPLANHKNGYLAAHANYLIGYCNLMTGRPQDAVARFQKVRSYYPYTKVYPYASLRLTQALLLVGDTFQTLVSTSQLSSLFSAGELQAVGDYLAGVLTLQLGQFERAANYFENVVTRNPKSSLREPAVALMLQALNAGENYRRAVGFGAKYLRDYPMAPGQASNPWRARTLYALAEAYYSQSQYNSAEQAYRQAYEFPVGSEVAPYALLGRSYCLIHLDRPEQAIPGLRRLLEEGPRDTGFVVSTLMGLGYAFFNQRQFDSARAGFEYVTERFPTRTDVLPLAHFYRGMCYRKLNFAGDAADAWGTIVLRYPDHPKAAEAAFRAGEVFFRAEGYEYERALNFFRFVTDRYPFSIYGPSAQAFLGTCYYNLNKFPDAIREHQKYLDLYPNDPQAPSVRKMLEMEYYRVVQYDPSYMDAFIKRYPESELAAQLRYDHALNLMKAQAYDSAAKGFQLVVVNHPNSSLAPKAQLSTGECYALAENWQQAVDAYKKYLSYYPNGTDRDAALFNLGVGYFRLNDYEKALASFQAVLNSFPNSAYAENARKNADITKRRLSATPLPGTAGGER